MVVSVISSLVNIMYDKTKALLIAALLLSAMAVAGNENDAPQNKQLQ